MAVTADLAHRRRCIGLKVGRTPTVTEVGVTERGHSWTTTRGARASSGSLKPMSSQTMKPVSFSPCMEHTMPGPPAPPGLRIDVKENPATEIVSEKLCVPCKANNAPWSLEGIVAMGGIRSTPEVCQAPPLRDELPHQQPLRDPQEHLHQPHLVSREHLRKMA